MKGKKEEEGGWKKRKEERKLFAVMHLGKQHLISQEGQRGCNVSLHHHGLGC